MSTLPRVVTDADGLWRVVHPFTGRVEFSTTERALAEAVGVEYDRLDPLSEKWLYETLYQLPRPARSRAEWVMSTATWTQLRKLQDSRGMYVWMPPVNLDGPVALLGKPVRIDETAVGISLQVRT